jgi:hypothetical protein
MNINFNLKTVPGLKCAILSFCFANCLRAAADSASWEDIKFFFQAALQ